MNRYTIVEFAYDDNLGLVPHDLIVDGRRVMRGVEFLDAYKYVQDKINPNDYYCEIHTEDGPAPVTLRGYQFLGRSK